MGRKVFKPIDCDADAGTHDEQVYDKALHPWRAKLRRMLLPIVRRETPYIAKLQVSWHKCIKLYAYYQMVYGRLFASKTLNKRMYEIALDPHAFA